MLGYCGMNCASCSSYTTTVTADKELLERAAARSVGGAPRWICLGCTPADQPFLSQFCVTCRIRACAIGRKGQNCAACDDYESCVQLRDFFKTDPAGAIHRRMDWLRQRFLALKEERAPRTQARR